jgi:hypothetical protein
MVDGQTSATESLQLFFQSRNFGLGDLTLRSVPDGMLTQLMLESFVSSAVRPDA